MVADASSERVAVLGDGGWGTALAIVLHENGHRVRLWSAFEEHVREMHATRENRRFLPGVLLSESIEITADPNEALNGATLVVAAIPTIYMRSVLARFAGLCRADVPVVSVAKGIEPETLMRGSEIVRDVLGNVPIGLLFGPSHAEEVARRLPTTVVASARDMELAVRIQRVFMTPRFRVYTNPDTIGVELGAAVKNVIAIASGICDGLGFGDNSKAALVTRGLAEIARLGVAMGAQRATFSGLTGLGDLITTCISPYGRNRHVGEQIGKGRRLEEVIAEMHGQVAEGVLTTKSVCALADRYRVEMPITREVYNVLFDGKSPLDAVTDLMLRAPRCELDEMRWE